LLWCLKVKTCTAHKYLGILKSFLRGNNNIVPFVCNVGPSFENLNHEAAQTLTFRVAVDYADGKGYVKITLATEYILCLLR